MQRYVNNKMKVVLDSFDYKGEGEVGEGEVAVFSTNRRNCRNR